MKLAEHHSRRLEQEANVLVEAAGANQGRESPQRGCGDLTPIRPLDTNSHSRRVIWRATSCQNRGNASDALLI